MRLSAYAERDATLAKMGFSSYADYLASKLWRKIRKLAFRANGMECVVCKEEASCLHHRTYSERVLSGKSVSSLVPLCLTCHELIEFDNLNKKRSLAQANAYLNRLLESPSEVREKKAKKRKRKFRPGERCLRCGQMPRKGKLYCRPCEPREIYDARLSADAKKLAAPDAICVKCKIRPAAKLSATGVCGQCTTTAWRLSHTLVEA